MKTLIIVLGVCLLSTSFKISQKNKSTYYKNKIVNNNLSENEININTAVKNKLIQCEFESSGKYSGKSIIYKIINLKNRVTNIKIPKGTYFVSQEKNEQDLITVEDVIIKLNPNEKKQQLINAYCAQRNDLCPKEKNKFTIGKNTICNMNELLNLSEKYTIPNDLWQDIVWSVSDKTPISNISVGQNQSLLKFRKELAKLLKVQDVWYDSPQNRIIEQNGSINHSTVKVQGNVSFENKEKGEIYQTVEDLNGKIFMKNDPKKVMNIGKISYYFTITVQSWEKGKYFVKLYKNNQVIHCQEFLV